ncbi:MAG: hypothetical protein CMO40_08770 [Verrucomicrobiaceae bacterium]|nr:hypothetical protein [Verrucomicrobiaceae bacterium]
MNSKPGTIDARLTDKFKDLIRLNICFYTIFVWFKMFFYIGQTLLQPFFTGKIMIMLMSIFEIEASLN